MNEVIYKDIDLSSGIDIEGIPSIIFSIRNMLTIPQGKLPGTPEFGFNGFVFGQNDDITKDMVEQEIVNVMSAWDSRIEVVNSDIIQNGNEVSLNVDYTIAKATPKSINIKIQEL